MNGILHFITCMNWFRYSYLYMSMRSGFNDKENGHVVVLLTGKNRNINEQEEIMVIIYVQYIHTKLLCKSMENRN